LSGIGPKVIAWEPEGKEAFQVEVRARIMGNDTAAENFPIVRWWTEVSAGNAVWKEPFPTPVDTVQANDFQVPARGMVWRTGARQFRIAFYNDGHNQGVATDEASVLQVSILPVWGTQVDTYPYQDANNRVNGKTHPFPMTAREWKITDVNGLPFALGGGSVIFASINGLPFPGGGADYSLYADWQPIPFEAAGWIGDLGSYAAYR